MALLLKTEAGRGDSWRRALLAADPGLDLRQWPEVGDPADIEYALVWFRPRARSRAIPT